MTAKKTTKMPVLIPPKTNKHFAQINQQIPGNFAFVNKVDENTFRQLHTSFKCRDFLGDAVWAHYTKHSVARYGFTFNPEKEVLDEDSTRLFFSGNCSALLSNLSFLNSIEEKNNLNRTQIQECENGVIVEADAKWQSCVWSISLLSFLIKVFSIKELSDGEDIFTYVKDSTNEASYIRRITKDRLMFVINNLSTLIGKKADTVTGWRDEDSYYVHDMSGIVEVFNQRSANIYNKHLNELLSAA